MTDPLDVFWASLESDPPLFTAGELRRWPAKLTESLHRLKLLRLTDNATQVVCPGCDASHVEEVLTRSGPDGAPRFFVRCPESLRVEVLEESLRQWTADFDVLVKLLSHASGAKGRPRAMVDARLWRVGKVAWRESHREVYFTRGLGWPDGRDIAARLPRTGRPIVVVADALPADHVWPGKALPVVPLSRVSSFDEGFEIDLIDMAAVVNEADMARRLKDADVLHETPSKQLTKALCRAQATALTDEALVRAYVTHGSYRKAADALVSEGHETNRWAVERAVKKSGGVEAVRRMADSHSIRRAVASQRRDGKRILPKNS